MALVFEQETYAIRSAVFEVYKGMGSGFLEAVYQECLETELAKQEIPFISQPQIPLFYKGEVLRQVYKPDFICYDQSVLEIKAVHEIADEHKAQLINYLKATHLKLGLLINFGSYPKVQIERFAL